MQNSTVGLSVAKICSYFNSRPRGDAARHKDRERSVPEPVPPADRTKLQPWLQRASARPDGLLALSDARSAGEVQIQQAAVGSEALKLSFPPRVQRFQLHSLLGPVRHQQLRVQPCQLHRRAAGNRRTAFHTHFTHAGGFEPNMWAW